MSIPITVKMLFDWSVESWVEKGREAISVFLIDQSDKLHLFGLFYRSLLVLFSRSARLEKMQEKVQSEQGYYNSTNRNFLISRTSRLMDQFTCNIRLINTSKLFNSGSSGSAFALIDEFADFQADTNDYLHRVFDEYLTHDQSALASGTLIGAQSTISTQFKDDLISSGLIHVVVASGYNLTVVMGFVQSFAQKVFSKKIALLLSLASVWWYVYLALSNPAILRAGWMASLSVLASLCGRPKSIWFVLLFSILFLVAFNPTLLVNISFQLSVSSTIGVLAINQRMDDDDRSSGRSNLFSKITDTLKENLQTTIGANLTTLPIILFWFGRVSLIAVVANTFLLWVIPYIMYASSIFLVASQLNHWLAVLTAFPIKGLSTIFLRGVHFFANFPFAAFEVQKITFLQLVLSYIGLFLLFTYWPRMKLLIRKIIMAIKLK
ncbi:MAG: ComEC/Rec2 family competence protein [Patescibacteria group bacterium]